MPALATSRMREAGSDSMRGRIMAKIMRRPESRPALLL